MNQWQDDPALEGLRNSKARGNLPEAERRQWEELWQDVATLIRLATEPAKAVVPK